MFTGLVEVVGTVEELRRIGAGARLELGVRWPDRDPPARGDSIAVNGACVTAVELGPDGFAVELSSETLSRTTLGELRRGARVNLERAVKVGARLGGHLVQGHVDTVVSLLTVRAEDSFARWRISLPATHAREVAAKGSVTVHGVSLTVAEVGEGHFDVALIPETLAATVLGGLRPGARLHLETDVLAKYVVRALGSAGPSSALEEMFGGGGRA
jgi:riboflavin synthase